MTLSLIVNGYRLHSRYNPEQEAKRYIDSLFENKKIAKERCSVIILTDPGAGYIYDYLKKLFPESRILILFYSVDTKNHFLAGHAGDSVSVENIWAPDNPVSPFAYLNACLTEWEVNSVQIISWPPSDKAFADTATAVGLEIKKAFLHWNKNLLTTAGFGKLWIRNIIKNFLLCNRVYPLPAVKGPIVIAASGPSLEYSMAGLKKNRNKYHLWALPSSLAALRFHNLEPDLIITTDPGFYASWHYRYIPKKGSVSVAFPLSAAGSPILSEKNINPVIFHQGLILERDILGKAGIDIPLSKENGTIAGTAYQLALLSGTSAVYFAGLDFCFKDISAHVRPHSFDFPILAGSDRRQPFDSLMYKRAYSQAPEKVGQSRRGPVLDVYGNWFGSVLSSGKRITVRRFYPSIVPLNGMAQADINDLQNYPVVKKPAESESLKMAPEAARRDILRSVMEQWIAVIEGNTEEDKLFPNSKVFDILTLLDTPGLIKLKKQINRDKMVLKKELYKIQSNAVEFCLNIMETYAGK